MKLKKVYKVIFILIIIYLSNFASVYGEADLDYKEINSINLQKSIDNGNIEVNLINTTNEYEVNVKLNTAGLNKGYYTGYIYDNQNMDLSNYSAISFFITNECESPIRINMNITTEDGKVLSPAADKKILIKEENSDIFQRVSPSYGTIELPEAFKGTICMPFNSFKEKNTGNMEQISKISSWGIIATLGENEEKEFKLSKFSLIHKKSELKTYFASDFFIEGDDIVQIPVAGEGISEYKVKGLEDKEIKFKLINPIEGITLNENGRLTIKREAEAQKFKISAEIGGKISEMKDIQLLKSWTLSAYEVDGTSKSMPQPKEVKMLLSEREETFLNNTFLNGARIIIFLCAIGFGILYRFWRRKK